MPPMTHQLYLTPQQQRVVAHDHGPALVFAVAGAGNTTALVYRIERLVREQVFAPAQILASSFGKANVLDLKQALRPWPDCRAVDVRTLHSLGRRAIATAQQMGYVQQLQLNGRHASTEGLDYKLLKGAIALARKEKVPFLRELDGLDAQDFLDYVGSCKGNLLYADLSQAGLTQEGLQIARQASPPSPALAWYLDLYQLYERVRLARGSVTFDDMLLTGWEVLVSFPDVLAHIQDRYRCVLVDEFQDINRAQSEILDLITSPHRNYMAIGDDDQTIYEWRGANPRYILNFPERYKAESYVMDDNFRCPAGPLTLANAVIQHNQNRRPKRLHLTRGFHGEISLTFVQNPDAMALEIVREIKRLQQTGASLNEIAILVRLNAQTPPLEQALISHQLPYRSSNPFFERAEITTLVQYGRLAWAEKQLSAGQRLSPAVLARTIEAWEQVANQPKRYLSREVVARISTGIRRGDKSISQIIATFGQSVHEDWLQEKLLQLARNLQWLAEHLDGDANQVLQQLEGRLQYIDYVRTSSGFSQTSLDRAAGVEAFIAYAAGRGSFQRFLGHIRDLSQQRKRQQREAGASRDNGEAITLSTIHGAKGLEWSYVFIPQCNQKTIPYIGPEEPNIEEERRLFYVALTRARENVCLYSLQREPISQFLQEAQWQKTLQMVSETRESLRRHPSQLMGPDALALIRAVAAHQWQRFFQNWWDVPEEVKTALAGHMAWFGASVRHHRLETQLDLSDEMLDWWLNLVSGATPGGEGDFPGLEKLSDTLTITAAATQSETGDFPGLEKLSDTPLIIRPGMWVQCDAGWGRIDLVLDKRKRPLPEAAARDHTLSLAATLRPDDDAERIEIDLATAEITFPQAQKLYTCALCGQFTTTNPNTLVALHNNIVHNGHLALRIEKEPRRRLTTLTFAGEEPKRSPLREVRGWNKPTKGPAARRS